MTAILIKALGNTPGAAVLFKLFPSRERNLVPVTSKLVLSVFRQALEYGMSPFLN